MKKRILVVALAFATWIAGMSLACAQEVVVVRSTRGEFAEVKERVLHAIENRGLVLNYTARIGAMLERTGKDIDATARVYGEAEMLEFCSARVSRDTMEADPRNIVFCPYAIAIYTLPKEKNVVYVGYRRPAAFGSPQSAKALRAVEQLLAGIVRDTLK